MKKCIRYYSIQDVNIFSHGCYLMILSCATVHTALQWLRGYSFHREEKDLVCRVPSPRQDLGCISSTETLRSSRTGFMWFDWEKTARKGQQVSMQAHILDMHLGEGLPLRARKCRISVWHCYLCISHVHSPYLVLTLFCSSLPFLLLGFSHRFFL